MHEGREGQHLADPRRSGRQGLHEAGDSVLERIPVTALGPDPMTNHLALNGKVILCRELFRYKRYGQMEAMTAQLIPMVAKLRFNADEKTDAAVRTQLRFDLTDLGVRQVRHGGGGAGERRPREGGGDARPAGGPAEQEGGQPGEDQPPEEHAARGRAS